MKIDGQSRLDSVQNASAHFRPAPAQSTGIPNTPPGGDENRVSNIAEAAAGGNPERVEALRRAVQAAGEYQVSASDLADSIIRHHTR